MIGAILGGVAGLAGSIWGGVQASKQAKKAKAELDRREKSNEDWYQRRYNEDYSQTAEAQHMLTQARETAMKQIAAARGAQAVMGGTEESVARTQEAANDMLANTMGNIAVQGTARKDAVENQYRTTADRLAQERINLYNQRAANATAAANGAMQAGMGLVGLDMQSGLDTGRGLFGEWLKKQKQG